MKLVKALPYLGLIGLVASKGYPLKIHVVSKVNSKGGICISVNEANVCSTLANLEYRKATLVLEVGSEDYLSYDLGFSNQCRGVFVNVLDVQIQWSEITNLREVYFHDDQCFWTTAEETGERSSYILKSEQGVKLCLRDQLKASKRSLHPTVNPFFSDRPWVNPNYCKTDYNVQLSIPVVGGKEMRQASGFQIDDSSNTVSPNSATSQVELQPPVEESSNSDRTETYQATIADSSFANGLNAQGSVSEDKDNITPPFIALQNQKGAVDNGVNTDNGGITPEELQDTDLNTRRSKRGVFGRRFVG